MPNLSDETLGELVLTAYDSAMSKIRQTGLHSEVANSMMTDLSQALVNYTGELIKEQNGMVSNVMGKKDILDRTAQRLETRGASGGSKYPAGAATAFVATFDLKIREELGIKPGIGMGAA